MAALKAAAPAGHEAIGLRRSNCTSLSPMRFYSRSRIRSESMGPPGLGKTHLAVSLANRRRPERPPVTRCQRVLVT